MSKPKLWLASGFLGAFLSLSLPAQTPQLSACDRVRILPAPGHEKEIVGAKISGSITSDKTGMVLLAEVTQAPVAGQWLELTIKNPKPYRWLRYDAPEGTRGFISKLEFYAGDQKLKGEYFSCWPDGWRSVLDDRPNNGSAGVNSSGQYFGLDIGDLASCSRPGLSPGGGDYSTPVKVSLTCKDPAAVIRYTLDGTTPTEENGIKYSEPIAIDRTTFLTAAAFSPGLAPSPISDGIYLYNPAAKRVMLNIGNSLTGNATGRFPVNLRAGGFPAEFKCQLMGGGITRTLWNAAMLEIADPNDKEKWDSLYVNTPCITHTMGGDHHYSLDEVKQAHESWKKLWPEITTLDDVTLQPRGGSAAEDSEYSLRWLNFVREKFPDVQPWLYVEWTEMGRQRETDKGTVPSYQMKTLFPALTWEESMSAMMLYGEEVQHDLLKVDQAKKKARIIPVALAFGWIRNQIEHGKFPGIGTNDYIPFMHSDIVHATPEGCYLIDAVWFAAMYGQSPEGKLWPWRTKLTPAQMQSMQRLAWDVVKNYPDCGLYETGTTPVGKPEFTPGAAAPDGNKPMTLSSSTPEAWFRYTLDGTKPTRTRGYIYCGVLTVRPGMTVKAIAYKSGMADSPVASMEDIAVR